MKISELNKDELEALYRTYQTKKRLAVFLNVNEKTIARYLKKYEIASTIGSQGARKHFYDDTYFESIDCEEKAYWLGFLMADGCVYKGADQYSFRLQINLKLDDKNHLELFQKAIQSHYKIQEKKVGKSDVCCLKINSTKLCKDLIEHGVVPRKSLICEPPKINEELVRHFIRGYFDGDGCIACCKNNRWSFSFVGGEEMLLFIQSKLLCHTSIYKIKHSQALSLEAASKESLNFLYNYLYKDASIYLNRKKEKYDLYYSMSHLAGMPSKEQSELRGKSFMI